MILYLRIYGVFYYFSQSVRKNFEYGIHHFLLESNQIVEIDDTILVCQGLSHFVDEWLWKAQSIDFVEKDRHDNPEQVHNNVSDTWLVVFKEQFEFIGFCFYRAKLILSEIKVLYIYWLQTLCNNYGHISRQHKRKLSVIQVSYLLNRKALYFLLF